MMNPYRMKALEGLLDYLSGLQGGDLKSLMDQGDKPPMDMMKPPVPGMEEGMDMDDDDMMGKPEGVSMEKVPIMGKPEMEDPMMEKPEMDKGGMDAAPPEMPKEIDATDDEMDELYKKFRR